VTSRAAASRYGRALFDVALAERVDLDRVLRELAEFSDVLTGNPTLQRALTNPAVPPSRKRAVIEQLIAKAGNMLPPVSKLLLLLAERDRLSVLPDILEAFRNRVLDYKNVVRAEVVTAIPLPPDRLAAVQAGLARATGRQVLLASRVDESIVGGAVTRLGSTVYDGSITRQLEKLKEALASATD
jgi:F-type H+-transporting ATPase subunit delta